MPAERLPMRKVREVLRQRYACGASERVIAQSLGIGRTAIRTHVMRTTVHLVTARDGATLRPVLQPVLDRSFASSPWAKKLHGVDLDTVAAAGRELLAGGGPLTRAQLGERLAERFPGADPPSLAHTVTIKVPEGSLLNARSPAAVAGGNVEGIAGVVG